MKVMRRSRTAHVTRTFNVIKGIQQIFYKISKIGKNENQINSINKKYII